MVIVNDSSRIYSIPVNLNEIPKPFIVAGVLLLGVALIPFLNDPHSVCHSQLKVFEEAQAGLIFPKLEKKVKVAPTYDRAWSSCYHSKVANSMGACAEYFSIVSKVTQDLKNFSNECGEFLQSNETIMKVLTQSLRVFAEIAWGDPPEAEAEDFSVSVSWLEPPDLATYCSVRDTWVRFFGRESFAQQKQSIQGKLIGELKKYEVTADGQRQCTNCESLLSAIEKFGVEKVNTRSIFYLNCDKFR